MGHPLDPLSPTEIAAAVAAVRADARLPERAWFSTVTVDEWGAETGRRARLLVVPGPDAEVVEAVVELAGPSVVDWTVHEERARRSGSRSPSQPSSPSTPTRASSPPSPGEASPT